MAWATHQKCHPDWSGVSHTQTKAAKVASNVKHKAHQARRPGCETEELILGFTPWF
jgi:hypothetical protein